jgi:hypothetical protein
MQWLMPHGVLIHKVCLLYAMQVIVTTENKVATVIQALQGVQTEETTALLVLLVTIGECKCCTTRAAGQRPTT